MVLLKKPSEGFKDNHASRCDAKFSLSLLNRHKLLRFGLFELFKIGSDLILRFFFSGSCWQIVADRNCCC